MFLIERPNVLDTNQRQEGAGFRDVKNEGRSDYVYENTDGDDIMSSEKHGFLQGNTTNAR